MRTVIPLKKQFELIDNTLEKRINTIIPEIMKEYGFDMWIVICREYNEDPLYTTMIPCLCLTARRLSCVIFTLKDGVFTPYNFGRKDKRMERFYVHGHTDTSIDQYQAIANLITEMNPQKIGINTSLVSGMGDGLTKQLYDDLCAVLTEEQKSKLTSAYDLSTRWIETRLDEELERYKEVYRLTMDITEEAFSRKVITPGVTTCTEVEEWIEQEINRLGLSFWFCPHVDLQRRGAGYLDGSEVIRPGDLMHYDVGLKYLGLCTDCQRIGYVLDVGETEVPKYLVDAFKKSNRFQDIVCEEHITGRTGNEILKISLDRAKEEGLNAMLYNHPIGLFGHSAGTIVGLWDYQGGIGLKGEFPLHKNTCYALELNTVSTIEEWGNQEVRFGLEETVSFTEDKKMNYLYPGRENIIAI